MEVGINGFSPIADHLEGDRLERIQQELRVPGAERILYVGEAFRAGLSLEAVCELSCIDPWFLIQIEDIIAEEGRLEEKAFSDLKQEDFLSLKRQGFSDSRLADLLNVSESRVRSTRLSMGVKPVYKRDDSRAPRRRQVRRR